MGNSRSQQSEQFNLEDWVYLYESEQGKLLRNRTLGTVASETALTLYSGEEFDLQKSIYKKRGLIRNSVPVLGIRKLREEGLCSELVKLFVYTEHLPRLLHHEDFIEEPLAMKYLVGSLEGFQAIHRLYDSFIFVTSKMIGLDSRGKVRVWLNQSFALNYAPETFSQIEAPEQERKMVLRIFELVESKCQGSTFSGRFIEHIQGNKLPIVNFERAIELVRLYSRQILIQLSERSLSVTDPQASKIQRKNYHFNY